MLLADLSQKKLSEDAELYRKSAVGALAQIMEGVCEYRRDIAEAGECLDKILGDHRDAVKEIFDRCFKDSIIQGGGFYYSNRYRCHTRYMAPKIRGEYYDGLVGKNGGLSTYIAGEGYVGAAVIAILEAAYTMEEIIYPEIVERLTPDIQRYIESVGSGIQKDVPDAVREMKQKMIENYCYIRERNFERLSITGRMVPREYLFSAYRDTHDRLGLDGNDGEKCLDELVNLFSGETWETQRCDFSIVKEITWRLINSRVELYRGESIGLCQSKPR